MADEDDILREQLSKLREAAGRDPALRDQLEKAGVVLDRGSSPPVHEPSEKPPTDLAEWLAESNPAKSFVPSSEPPVSPRRSWESSRSDFGRTRSGAGRAWEPPEPYRSGGLAGWEQRQPPAEAPPEPSSPLQEGYDPMRVSVDPVDREQVEEAPPARIPYWVLGIVVLLGFAVVLNWVLLPWDRQALLEGGPRAVAHHLAIEALLDESGLGVERRLLYHDPRAKNSDRLGSLEFDAIQERYPVTIHAFEPRSFFDFPTNFVEVVGNASTPDGDKTFKAVFTFKGGPVLCLLITEDRRSSSGRCADVGSDY